MRIRVRYRLRALFVLTLVIACLALAASTAVSRFREHEQQRARLEEVQSICFQITPISYVFTEGEPVSSIEKWHNWLRGQYPSSNILAMGITAKGSATSPAIAEALDRMEHFPALFGVELEASSAKDQDIDALARAAPQLTYLNVAETMVTDRCLKSISKLQQLEVFLARNTQITGEGFTQDIGAPPSLSRIDLSGSQLNDAGFSNVIQHAALEELDISRTQVHASQLQLLSPQRLPNLKSLTIRGLTGNSDTSDVDFALIVEKLRMRFPRLRIVH